MLITSVGSLVGTNILDVLESQVCRRRERVYVVGTNSLVHSPNNFRCDACYRVPNTASSDFISRMVDIIRKEEPDIILSARDADTEVMARLMHAHPQLKGKLPYGELKTLTYALNKWETWLFTQKHSLPFAGTFVMGKSGGKHELKQFADLVGYPMIAKPIQGFASKGVFFVRDWDDAKQLAALEDYIFQEYLGKPNAMDSYFEFMNGLVPMFAHAPNVYHHSCHTFISPSGDMDRIFISRNEHDSGATIGFRRVSDPELEELAISYAKAIYSEGGYGPLTIQFKKDRNGAWKAQEMSLRTNGNTYPRFIMGQDDIGLIVNGILPEIDFPIYHAQEEASKYIIAKSLCCNVLHINALEMLGEKGLWSMND